jgi:thiol:disulfide interchange protein DsbC
MKLRVALLSTLAIALAACARGADSEAPAAAPAAGPAADAAPAATQPVPPGDPRIALAAKMPGTRPEDLRASPVPGIYELAHNGEVSYVSADGAYVFAGDLYQVTADGEFPNLSEARRREARRALLAAIPAEQMIAFGPADAPHAITVFTDVDCQWCQRMHAEIAAYNAAGIRVRYLSYPRTGPDTEAWHKAEAVWCAADRNAALTAAKQGKDVTPRSCDAPIARHYELGRQVGITGTPGVLLATGEMIPGYLPPRRMLEAIEESESSALTAQTR